METEGYITDTTYTQQYYMDLNPTLLNYVGVISGFKPIPLDQEFTYCELGCGYGLTTNILASVYPKGKFFGVDLNENHIKSAQKLAEDGGLTNIQFINKPFSELVAFDDLPELDFITMHGVWSWVSPKVHKQILDIIDEKLKPSGLVELSYNAMPAWAPFIPLRNMMLAYTDGKDLDSLGRVKEGLKYISFLKNYSKFFKENPHVATFFERMAESDPHYIAHEYFHEHWGTYYFYEVSKTLRQIPGFHYVGSLPIWRNYSQFCFSEEVHKLMKTAPDKYVMESHKDFFSCDLLRRDVWSKSKGGEFSKDDALEYLKHIILAPANLHYKLPMTVKLPVGDVDVDSKEAIFVFAEMAARPQKLSRLVNSAGNEKWAHLAQMLLAFGICTPCANEMPDGPVELSRFNTALINNNIPFIASPVIGGGVGITHKDVENLKQPGCKSPALKALGIVS